MNLYGLTDAQMFEVYKAVEKEIFTDVYRNALKELLETYDEADREKIRTEFDFEAFVEEKLYFKKYQEELDFEQTGYTLEIDELKEAIKEDLDI